MQIDMHYGAILYLGLLAGVPPAEAQAIAWSSQHVDDAKFGGVIEFSDGKGMICVNSAHPLPTDNLSPLTRFVWIPFHFIPGCAGSTLRSRLACAADAAIARDAVLDALRADGPRAAMRAYRFGVALHAYADTWSHQGFSGLWSDLNRIEQVRPTNVSQGLWDRFKSWVGDLVARLRKGMLHDPVGHLMADVCPDLPYLSWKYVESETGKAVTRTNSPQYLLALERIYGFFQLYLDPGRALEAGPTLPGEARTAIEGLLNLKEDDAGKRLDAWLALIRTRFPDAVGPLPGQGAYDGSAWIRQAFGDDLDPVCIKSTRTWEACAGEPFVLFTQALRAHSECVSRALAAQGIAS